MDEIPNINLKDTQAAKETIEAITPQPAKPKKNVHDWLRDLRMSPDVNQTTVGVATDRVTPELLMATAGKLIKLNRREVEPDAKDSLQFQRFYGPTDYFAEHVLRDANRVGRQLLWKATNKGNLDFMPVGALEQHVSDVFNSSKMANMVDNSSPLEGIEGSFKVSRIGEGGIASQDSAPVEMRLVQPSYLGFIDAVATPECATPDHAVLTRLGWKPIADITLDDEVACLVDGKAEWRNPTRLHAYDYKGFIYKFWTSAHERMEHFYVTANHRIPVFGEGGTYDIFYAKQIYDWFINRADPDPSHFYLDGEHETFLIGYDDSKLPGELPSRLEYEAVSRCDEEYYEGKVYCLTVPGGIFYMSGSGKHPKDGYWTGNSFRVGLDGFMTKNVMKGSDGKLYQKFINAHTGKEELVDSVTASKSIVATPEMMNAKTDHIFAVGGKTGVRIVKKSDVDYYLPRMDDAFTNASNLVPMMSGVKELRLRMGCLHPLTPMLVVAPDNHIQLIRAKDTSRTTTKRLPGASKDGTVDHYRLRASYAKFPGNRSWFRKVVLYSGRTVITSRDHKWPVLRKDGSIALVQAEKLKQDDRLLRTTFKDMPARRTFIDKTLVTKDTAVLLGYAVRSFSRPDTEKFTFTYQKRHEQQIRNTLERFGALEDSKFYVTAHKYTVAIPDCTLRQYLIERVGCEPGYRQLPSEILSARTDIVASFIDAYTADETKVAMDSLECSWVLDIDNAAMRDGIAFLFARLETDSLYRDSYLGDGKYEFALKLVPFEHRFGDCVIDLVKAVVQVPNAPIMIDIDIDDNMYAVANGVVTHNSKYPQQAVPIEGREPPLVRPVDEASGKDMATRIGRFLGARFTRKPGTVTAVRNDRVDMLYDDGTKGSVSLYRNFPMNAKGYLDNKAQVKAGQHLNKGDLVASSNYTDDKGVQATGTNLRVGWLSWKGGTYEDAIVISESAAKKLTSDTMYATGVDLDKTVQLGKNNYLTWKPAEYTKEQLENLDNDGVVKPGMTLHKGDPIALAVRTTEPSPGTMGKRILTDVSATWDHEHPGVVTDVVKGRKGVRVFAKVSAPAEVGDKLSGCFDEETEIFTKRGFVRFAELTRYDEVAVLCQDGKARWEIPFDYIGYKVDGTLYAYKDKLLDFMVTGNHRMLYTSREDYERNHSMRLQIAEADTLCDKRIYIKRAAVFDNPRNTIDTVILPDFPHGGRALDTNDRFPVTDFAALFGLWLAEGHIDKRLNLVLITQSRTAHPELCKEIEALLSRLGLRWRYEEGRRFAICSKNLTKWLAQFGHAQEKYIPEEVFKTWPESAQRALLDWHYKGDGDKTSSTKRAATVSERLCRGLQRLHILLGDACNYTDIDTAIDAKLAGTRELPRNFRRYRITQYSTDYHQINNQHKMHQVPYNGYVYCVSTKAGRILVCRHGKVMWCGNCYGNKGVVSHILPDDEMPVDKDGKPLEMILSPLGLVSRTNGSMLHEALLGKVAHVTGQPELVTAFTEGNLYDLVESKLRQHHLKADDDFFDQETGARIPEVVNGYAYVHKLKHLSESKMSGRGTAQYSSDETPGGSGYEGCFPAMQNVMTIHGEKSIATICEKRQPEYVLTWDGNTWCYKQITDWFTYRTDVDNLLNIATEYNISTVAGRSAIRHHTCLYPTKNHKMYRADMTEVLAGDLKEGDMLAGIGPKPTADQLAVLYGTLLGDAGLHPKDDKLQCEHALSQLNWVTWKYDALKGLGAILQKNNYKTSWRDRYDPTKKRYGSACAMHMPKSAIIQQVRVDMYDGNKRMLTASALERLGELGFCVWFLDDGSMNNHSDVAEKPKPEAKLCTNCFAEEQVLLAMNWIDKLTGVPGGTRMEAYVTSSGEHNGIIHFNRAASWRVAELVAKHIPWQAIPQSKRWLVKYSRECQTAAPPIVHDFRSQLAVVPMRILSIKPYKHDKPGVTNLPVYDFTVEDTHKYTLSGGVLVSNSKRFGTLEQGALVGHGAFDVIQDNKLIRGQSNADFWRSVRTGEIPTMPGEPLVHKKFFAHLQGAGINVRKTPRGISIFAISNPDVQQLAANRELKSRDTYEAKNFRPINGGLFGQDVFGINGDQWGYIQLDEPVPNPVMAEPLAKLLRMSDKDFTAVASAEKEVNGMSNSTDLRNALAKVNLEQAALEAQREFKNAPASKKDAALKRYVAIENMRRQGMNPAEYMLDRIPVLPPVYRPITSHNGLTMVADANYLYAQLLDARDDMRDAKNLPKEYQDKARSNLYRTWQELTGMYSPQDIKLRNKNVGGLLAWALGSGSPKFSAAQRKIIGTSVDTVGRGVVVPDSRITVDQIGLPIKMAFSVMGPFVERELVKRGYSPVDAIKMTKKQTPQARDALDKVVQTHPVLLNRAPTLHKYNILAFKPVLVTGNALHVHPSVCPEQAMDFDGDTVNIHVPVSDAARREALEKMLPSKNLIGIASHKIINKPEKEYMQGLYIATRMGESPDGRARIFRTKQEALDAYRNGEIDINTPIRILG